MGSMLQGSSTDLWKRILDPKTQMKGFRDVVKNPSGASVGAQILGMGGQHVVREELSKEKEAKAKVTSEKLSKEAQDAADARDPKRARRKRMLATLDEGTILQTEGLK